MFLWKQTFLQSKFLHCQTSYKSYCIKCMNAGPLYLNILNQSKPEAHLSKAKGHLFSSYNILPTFISPILLTGPYFSQYQGYTSAFSVQSLSHISLFATPWTAACQVSLSITNSQSLLKLISIESVMPSNHLILCHPLLFSPSIFPSIRVFSNESVLCIRWPKHCSFSFSISLSIEYSGLISFRMDWLDLLAVQGTLKSLLQHHSSKASICQCSAFFIVQLSHPYMTTSKTIALLDRLLLVK